MRELYPAFDGTQPCRTVDPEIFFPEWGTPPHSRLAKELCQSCPFIEPCLSYALRFQVAGIWGGTTEGQRRRLRKDAGVTAHPFNARTAHRFRHDKGHCDCKRVSALSVPRRATKRAPVASPDRTAV